MSVFAEKWNPGYLLQIISILFVVWLVVAGFMYSIYGLLTLDIRVKRGDPEKPFMYYLRSINCYLSLLVTGTLAGGYVIALGVALLNGMWYVESDSNFLTGLGVVIGLVLILFVPVPMSKGVHLLRSSRNQSIVLIRNVALLLGVLIPTYNMWNFAIREDKSHMDSIWELLAGLASANLS
jgi:hypothetical protein